MVFGVGQFNYASHIWLGHSLVAMATLVSIATEICDFQHKIGPFSGLRLSIWPLGGAKYFNGFFNISLIFETVAHISIP